MKIISVLFCGINFKLQDNRLIEHNAFCVRRIGMHFDNMADFLQGNTSFHIEPHFVWFIGDTDDGYGAVATMM
jgi:hypothetical protein